MKNQPEDRTCLSCQNAFSGSYCNHCGEKVIGPEDRKLKVLLGEFVSALFNLDNKFIKTIGLIIRKPGQLSENYAVGKRKAFFKPSSLYLLLTVVYFVFTPFEIFVPKLSVHTESTVYATYAQEQVTVLMADKFLSREAFENRYSALAPGVAKWLILFYIPTLGAILMLLFYGQRTYLADHFLLSIEINIYNMFVHFLLLPALLVSLYFFFFLFGIKGFNAGDSILVPLIGLSLMRFFILSFRRFYRQKWWITVAKSIVFTFALGSFAFSFYRLLLFWITIRLI